MKDHTILVVVCVNNEELFKQCESQIRNIFVPQVTQYKFFRYEMHKVWRVHNRALSYPAKYKVYIHQDTYLINRDMFSTLISLLKKMKSLV